MRISDWSSDVCSSDLRPSNLRQACSSFTIFATEPTVEQVSAEDEALVSPEALGELVAGVSARLAAPDTKPRAKFANFPSGSVKYGADEFYAIGKASGGGWDVDLRAEERRVGKR